MMLLKILKIMNDDKVFGSLISQEALRGYWNQYKVENNVGNSRQRINVIHRHAFAVVSRENVKLPLTKIGSIIERDHATVIHACKNHEMNYRFDADYRSIYNTILIELQDLLLHSGIVPKTISDTNEVKDIHFKFLRVSRRLRQLIMEFEQYKKEIASDKKAINVAKNYMVGLEERNNNLHKEVMRLKNLL